MRHTIATRLKSSIFADIPIIFLIWELRLSAATIRGACIFFLLDNVTDAHTSFVLTLTTYALEIILMFGVVIISLYSALRIR